MLTVSAYAATSADGPLEKVGIERRDLGPLDVLIEIKYSGICHSDIHTARNEWGGTHYPVVPGHEIAGVVAAVGSEVTLHEVGDRVGVGCFVDSCGACDACASGDEQYCTKRVVQTYNSRIGDGEYTMGGYSTHIVVTEGSCSASRTVSRWTSPRRCSAQASRCTRRCGTGARVPASRWRSSAWVGSGTSG
ncbi:alcohol dehydrogenase GroES-like domain protein [Rhodococcus sp. MTM3W5.2]|nr:alcohol dehydrogenase GroES-like domain protein [Rhodococcus sp. MTM3W5.2]